MNDMNKEEESRYVSAWLTMKQHGRVYNKALFVYSFRSVSPDLQCFLKLLMLDEIGVGVRYMGL